MKLIVGVALLGLVACSSTPGPVVPETKVQRQMIGLLEKFDRWDEDGDGYLTASELKPAEAMSGYSTARILEFYDTNHSGGISLREAQAGFKRVDEAERKAKL